MLENSYSAGIATCFKMVLTIFLVLTGMAYRKHILAEVLLVLIHYIQGDSYNEYG